MKNENLDNLIVDASRFMGDLLERFDRFNEAAEDIADGLHEIADALRWQNETIERQNCAMHTVQTAVQNKEASSSSPLSSPLKEDEERSKEGEEKYPPIIPPSSPEENCTHESARAEMDQIEQSFEDFWQAYDYKVNRKRAWMAWKNLSKRDRAAARAAVEAYKANCDKFQRQMCHAVTYLRQRRWEDDFNSGLENADRINGRNRIFTREDLRKLEQRQRMEEVAQLAADVRAGRV